MQLEHFMNRQFPVTNLYTSSFTRKLFNIHLQVIEEGQRDSKQHVNDTQDYRHLHLKRVQESQLICGDIPNL